MVWGWPQTSWSAAFFYMNTIFADDEDDDCGDLSSRRRNIKPWLGAWRRVCQLITSARHCSKIAPRLYPQKLYPICTFKNWNQSVPCGHISRLYQKFTSACHCSKIASRLYLQKLYPICTFDAAAENLGCTFEKSKMYISSYNLKMHLNHALKIVPNLCNMGWYLKSVPSLFFVVVLQNCTQTESWGYLWYRIPGQDCSNSAPSTTVTNLYLWWWCPV